MGKPKGMFQILYERDFLEPNKPLNLYTLVGKKDEYGHVLPGTSFEEMINTLIDFQDEEILL